MITLLELQNALIRLNLPQKAPVIVHVSLSAFGTLEQGAEGFLEVITSTFSRVLTPAFTYKTMLIPETGPERNGLEYGSGKDLNRLAAVYHADLPVDHSLGIFPESFRHHPLAQRSSHPILSFSAIGLPEALETQSLKEPLGPLQWLKQNKGWVLLVGVDHTSNTSIHLAENLAGRNGYLRWALTQNGVLECPGFPGCSNGFGDSEKWLLPLTCQTLCGNVILRAIPLAPMIALLVAELSRNSQAMLCKDPECLRCHDNALG